MLHLILRKGPWFRAKRYGIGAGLPIAWQGWAFLALHLAFIVGVAALNRAGPPHVLAGLVLLAALVPWPVYQARTEGGWHWRWGNRR